MPIVDPNRAQYLERQAGWARHHTHMLKDALQSLNEAAALFDAGDADKALVCIQIGFPYLVRTLADPLASLAEALGFEDSEGFLTEGSREI